MAQILRYAWHSLAGLANLTRYGDTFKAFIELVNNSIQAQSKRVEINVIYTNDLEYPSGIKSIEILDDGHGVAFSEFQQKVLEIATTSKLDGQGVGRFSSFQIGELMHIETVGFDKELDQFTKTKFGLDTTDLEDASLSQTELKVDFEELGNENQSTYYKVRIEQLHHNKQETITKKNKIVRAFLEENFKQCLFERYPFEIFNSSIDFVVNGESVQRDEFVIEKPSKQTLSYTDVKGREHSFDFFFYNIKAELEKVKVFMQVENAGLKSIAHEFNYSSAYHTPDLGTWFIYVDASKLEVDLFRNLDLEGLGEKEVGNLKSFIKDSINDFFKKRNKRYDNFLQKLKNDDSYPYKSHSKGSASLVSVFDKAAYLVENEHHLLTDNAKIRKFVYPLIDRTLRDGNVQYIFEQVLQLSDENLERFKNLVQQSDLEDVVKFASSVAEKMEFLDFLYELVYGEISKYIKERKHLHKILENNLWLFGENYNGTPHLWSDKKLGNNLIELRDKYFDYEPSEDDDNIISLKEEEGMNDITDLFFTNEKITDAGKREVMVVELKSPKCAISQKELNQIDRYAFSLESEPSIPSNDVKYKLILISSKLTAYAQSEMKSKSSLQPSKPFYYGHKTEKDIEIYVLQWADLIELNRRKLGYLSNQLSVKDKTVSDKFNQEYSDIIDEKLRSQLRTVK